MSPPTTLSRGGTKQRHINITMDAIRARISSPRLDGDVGYLARILPAGFIEDGCTVGDGLCPSLLAVLDASQVCFSMVCPFEVMIDQGTTPPSGSGAYLVVTVRPSSLSIEAAEEVVHQLYQVLLRFRLDFMGVEICESAVTFFGPDLLLLDTAYSFAQTYGPPTLGIGIGPADGSGQSGSLGFYLKVEYEGSIDVLALTCHHVVAPGNDAPVCLEDPIVIESPPQADHDAWIATLILAIQDSTVNHNFYTAMQGTTANPAQVDDNSQTACMSDELRLRIAQNFSRNTGLVRISSGMTADVLCSRRLDWALVELTASQFAGGMENLSNKPPARLLDYLIAHRYGPQKAAARSIVFKIGRTTGPTMGFSSGYRAVVQVFQQAKTVRSIENIITSSGNGDSFTHVHARARSNDFNDDADFSDVSDTDFPPSDAEDLDAEDPGQDSAPLSNPPPTHKLYMHKYDPLDNLMADLQEYCARAHFTVVKVRPNDYIKGFAPTRVDFALP
ncbi:hypothetical protein B0H67DRAFT_647512 [Lasiosphaeris hirsuta]|uniref:Uncharacterized protein n=1 Tax=Lasiosphaeris hirsuta TaxID=260670 RepID=A0AA40DL78_9PEZI|nr:hypothetical protein B0H67DRAFT_647512 [Lasiosphaeris hirsuta]